MSSRPRAAWAIASILCLLAVLTIAGLSIRELLALPFRETNDRLHRESSPLNLDFLIPGGTYVDPAMTVGEVAKLRFRQPGHHMESLARQISTMIPDKYRVASALALYLFWSFLFVTFFRVFTWMRYSVAFMASLACGAAVYYFMPDPVLGRADDGAFLLGVAALIGAARWRSKRKKA